jgi:hypothetical protein
MDAVAGILVLVGWLTMFVGSIMVLIAAFRESVLWGIGCLFIAPVTLFFIITHWSEAKKGFFIQLAGIAIILVAILVLGHSGSHPPH